MKLRDVAFWALVTVRRGVVGGRALAVVLGLVAAVLVAVVAIGGGSVAAVQEQVARSDELTQVEVTTLGDGESGTLLTTAAIEHIGRIRGVTKVTPDYVAGIYAASDALPAFSLTAHSLFPARPAPLLAGAGRELGPATAVFPAIAQGVDFRPWLGHTLTVGFTARTGPDRGTSRVITLTVVALFDPTYQVDGADVAYVDRGTLLKLAAAREGLDPATYADRVGARSLLVSTTSQQAARQVARRLQAMGFAAVPAVDRVRTVAGVVAAVRPAAVVLLGLVLAVGVVLGHSIARAAGAARLSEFSTLRVLGWRLRDVRRLLICEGLALGAVVGAGGAVVGTGLGFVLMAPVAEALSLDLPRSAAVLEPWQYAVCLLLPAVVVVLGTMIGSARSLRDDPYLVAQAQRR